MAGVLLTGQEVTSVKAQLIIDEGRVEKIYKNSDGYLMFGIGHLVMPGDPEHGKPEHTPVSSDRIEQAFRADLDQAINDSSVWSDRFKYWPDEVREIVVNMMFTLGLAKMNTLKTFKAALERKDWKKAALEIQNSSWHGQKGARAKRLVTRMSSVPEVRMIFH